MAKEHSKKEPAWSTNFNEIPKEVFTREDIFENELERIFYGAEWHPVVCQNSASGHAASR